MDQNLAIGFVVVLLCIWGIGLIAMTSLETAKQEDEEADRANRTWQTWTQPEVWDGIEIREDGTDG